MMHINLSNWGHRLRWGKEGLHVRRALFHRHKWYPARPDRVSPQHYTRYRCDGCGEEISREFTPPLPYAHHPVLRPCWRKLGVTIGYEHEELPASRGGRAA